MRINTLLFLFILLTFFMVSCVSRGIDREDYYNRLGKRIELGMTKSEFKQIFPESIPRGAKQYPKGSVEVLQVTYKYYDWGFGKGMQARPQWFYFYDGKLLQYGEPGAWPSDPDLIIEKRIR